MRIAILGAGIQGCSVAMELASRGHHVDLFDQAPEPMSGASLWNEGKLHLGYVYGLDPSMRTARRMIEGSLGFFDFFRQHLGLNRADLAPSTPFEYLVPNDSMMSLDEVGRHLSRCDEIIQGALAEGGNYIGERELARSEPISIEGGYNEELFQGGFLTPELSINISQLARHVTDHIGRNPGTSFFPSTTVTELHRDEDGRYSFSSVGRGRSQPYERLVNTTWQNRLALDKTLGIEPGRSWLHRYKIATHIENAPPLASPSCTMVLGAYGDFVNFGDGRCYLSWYPVGKIGESSAIQPEEWEDNLTAADKSALSEQMLLELGKRIPELSRADWSQAMITTRGGHIFAWGDRDITCYDTALHERDKSGVHSHGGYYSIDTGKYCTATICARDCADQIGS